MYVKMFTQIFDSSIADDYQVRHVFEDICKLADVDGVVDMTPEAIASRTRVPLKIVNTSLAKLAAPDPRSRSPEEEGRRIVLIDSHRDWGWRIVNYEHYRQLRDDDARRSYFRDYMRQYRAKKKADGVINSKQMLNDVNHGKPPSTHAEAESEAEVLQTVSERSVVSRDGVKAFESFWSEYPKKSSRMDAEHAFVESGALNHMDDVLHALAMQKRSDEWRRDNGRYIPKPSTWLRDRRWEDQPLQNNSAAEKFRREMEAL